MTDQERAEAIDNRLTEAGFHVALPHLHYDEGGEEPATWSARVSAPLETWEEWVKGERILCTPEQVVEAVLVELGYSEDVIRDDGADVEEREMGERIAAHLIMITERKEDKTE